MKARREVTAFREKVHGEKVKTFKVTLTEGQIAILKASLKYYILDDSFGYALWEATPGAALGRVDAAYMHIASDIMGAFGKLSKVKPDFGWWGDIDRLLDLCEKEAKKARKEGKEAEAALIEYYEKEERTARKKRSGRGSGKRS